MIDPNPRSNTNGPPQQRVQAKHKGGTALTIAGINDAARAIVPCEDDRPSVPTLRANVPNAENPPASRRRQ